MKERDKIPAEGVLIALYNASAVVAHVLGTDGDRPVSWWSWRLGTRMLQYAILGLSIALPLWVIGGGALWPYWATLYGIIWVGQLSIMTWKLGKILWSNFRR
jgi:hypothetical protein